MTHILNLLSGDRHNPTSTLNLNQLTGGEIRLTSGGLTPNPGTLNVLYTGESIRYDGELPVKEARSNMVLELRYNLKGGSPADLTRIQRDISQFLRDAKLYNQDGLGEAVWLEYRWNTSQALDDLPRPTWGQLNYYAEILSADVKWPDNIHEPGYLAGNLIEGVICTLTCKPHWVGLEQQAVNTPGLMDVTDQYNTTLDFDALDLSGEFAIAGWFEATDGLAANNIALRYYIDTNNSITVYQTTGGSIVLNYRVSGTSTTRTVAGNTDAPNHFVVAQGASTAQFYVNGAAAGATVSANAWSTSATLFVGCYDAAGNNTETTTTLDGLRFWIDETLTATQIAALYTEEKAIKDAGGWVGRPPYQYTYNATGRIYRGNSTTSGGYNCAVVGNVNGSGVDALAKYTVTPSAPIVNFYIGRLSLSGGDTIANRQLFLDASTTSSDTSSQYDYKWTDSLAAGADSGSEFFYSGASSPEGYVSPGRFLVLARVLSNGDDTTAVLRKSNYPSSILYYTENESVTITDSANWQLIELGEFIITDEYYNLGGTKYYLGKIVISKGAGTAAASIGIDSMQFLPYPYIKISGSHVTNIGTDDVVVYGNRAFYAYEYNVTGEKDGVTLESNKYNHVYFQFDDYSGSVDVNGDYLTLATVVIPRWTLPGGLVA